MNEKPAWLRKMFPWQQKSLRLNGRTMAYLDEGDPAARPVILLHGNPTWGFLYRDFIEPLKAAGYRVIVPDWIGAGYSDHPRLDSALTLAHHIADLVALIDALDLCGFAIVGQDWGGPQGVGAALQRIERLDALVLMNTWLYTDYKGKFHQSPLPWTTWHAPFVGQLLMKRFKVLSHAGPSAISKRGMSADEKRAYHHVYDEPDSDAVVMTWPRTIPLREGDRGWADMAMIQRRLLELAGVPTLLVWAPEDNVFPIEYCNRLKELLPHAEGPILFDRAAHFLQDDRGPDVVATIIPFLSRAAGARP
jgi:pimeloyl-ACP methyl ester carboxylesterase